jgi:hypothetical protein
MFTFLIAEKESESEESLFYGLPDKYADILQGLIEGMKYCRTGHLNT